MNSHNFAYQNNLKTKHIEQKSADKLFFKYSFWKILNTWFNPTGEFLGEPGNIQVIKNWQSHKYTEHETIRMIKNIAEIICLNKKYVLCTYVKWWDFRKHLRRENTGSQNTHETSEKQNI